MTKEVSPEKETNLSEQSLSSKGKSHVNNRTSKLHGVNVLVLDSAHSWLICLANFVILTFTASFSRLNYMTFLDIVQRFDVTITSASIGFTLNLISISIMSTLVTSLIVPSTGERVACFLCTCISCLASYGIGQSPNIAVYILLMTVKGACTGAITVPSVAMLSKYFDKRRSLATAIACSGLAAGSMGAPPLVEIMLRHYGLQWTYIIMAALEMNSLWASMLLRPTGRYKSVRRHDHPSQQSSGVGKTSLDELELQPLTEPRKEEREGEQVEYLASNLNGAVLSTNILETSKILTNSEPMISNVDCIESTKLDFTTENLDIPAKLNGSFKVFIDQEFEYSEEPSANSVLDMQIGSSDGSSLSQKNSATYSRIKPEEAAVVKMNGYDDSNVASMETKEVFKSDQLIKESDSKNAIRKGQSKTKSFLWSILLGLYHAFNLNLMKTWSMRFLLFYCTTATVIMYIPSYLPTIAVKANLTADQVSLLLIASGGVDFVGRIALGAFADLKILTACQIVGISQLLMGTVSQFAVYYNSFGTMMILAISSGLLSGSRTGLASIVCYEFMGPENLLKSFGVQTMLATLSLGLHHPLLSSLLEATGSFAAPLHYVGAAAYISAIFVFLQPQAKRLDSRHRVVRA